ncbi:putative phage tail assembly chaperone [Aeromonas schubertii]|uniref:putative phage tail assembly chaperone n=1 Tax=Aeromonas schubertii TaxID=652 RepID=UPI0010A7E9EF|nr:putative phage tail assembly chaperone [Aeromonas schubertii]QCG49478.1 hypothetical protein E2P79_18040 [Aeromonas schubertii]
MSKLTLTVAGTEITFEPTMVAYNGYINDLLPGDKVAPAHNYLQKIVAQGSKESLAELLKRPGAALQLTAVVNEHFAPQLEISVKN